MVLGWLFTSMLSPEVNAIPQQPFDNTYAASTGILNDPTGFGADVPFNKTQHAPSSANAPTIKGALGDLSKAMGDKISSWTGHAPAHNGVPTNASSLTETQSNVSDSLSELIQDGQSEDERLGARTRIGKCTILFNGNNLWERAIKSHEAHDKMHGYRLHVLRQQLLDDVWSKPAYILSLILRELAKPESERLEWLFWVDADTILLNPNIPIEAFLPPPGADFDHINLMYSNDWNGLNNGVFPIRVNKWAAELLSTIVAFRYYRPNERLTFRDQSAMDIIMKEPKFAKNIIQLPQRWFNAYQGEVNETLAPHQIRRGDLLVHFAGVIERDKRMAYWLDRAEQHMDDWEIPYKSTSYPQETRDFWNEQRRIRETHKTEVAKARAAATELIVKVDDLLSAFADRLDAKQLESIKKTKADLSNFLGKEDNVDNIGGLNEHKKKLEAVMTPLETVKKESHKVLLTSAHEAIFAGEKDLLESGFYKGVTNPESVEVDAAVKRLKELVLIPEETWDRQKIISTVDALTTARAKLEDKIAALEAAKKQEAAAAEAAKKKAEEAEKAAASKAAVAAEAERNRESEEHAKEEMLSKLAEEGKKAQKEKRS